MEPQVIIGILVGVATLFLTGFSLWYKIDRDTNAKIDSLGKVFAEQLANAQRQGDEKRARIYERLDTVKTAHRGDMDIFRKEIFEGYVPVRLCTLVHSNAEKTFADFKKALESLGTKLDTLLGRS